jgi:long-chain acyl-CoA synthetase
MIYVLFMKLKGVVLMLVDENTDINLIKNFLKLYMHEHVALPEKLLARFNFFTSDKFRLGHYFILKLKNKKKSKSKVNTENKLLLSTSGSLGSVKFVRLSEKNLKFNTNQISKYLNINSHQSTITTMPLSYSYMLSVLNTHLENGGKIYFTNKSIIQRDFWNYFNKNKVNSFYGVPYHYQLLAKNKFKFLNSKNLKYVANAGSKLDVTIANELINFCKKKKIYFFSMYGQTEASPRISYLPLKFLKTKTESIGKGLPGTKIWIENENQKKIKKPYINGELICKGKNISLGYCKSRKDLSKSNTNQNILRTGDLAYFDSDKFFYINGRTSRIAKIFGNRINLDELEKRLSEKNISSACKFSNDKILLFIEGRSISEKRILNTVEKLTNLNSYGFKVRFRKKFPRTQSGKISYTKII